MRKIEQNQVAQAWKKPGFSCQLWTDPPGQQWIDYVHHSHERWMLVIVGFADETLQKL